NPRGLSRTHPRRSRRRSSPPSNSSPSAESTRNPTRPHSVLGSRSADHPVRACVRPLRINRRSHRSDLGSCPMTPQRNVAVNLVRGPFVRLAPHEEAFTEDLEDEFLTWTGTIDGLKAMDLF